MGGRNALSRAFLPFCLCHRRSIVLFAATVLTMGGCGKPPSPPAISAREITLRAGDGVELSATLYVPAEGGLRPGLTLLHREGADRQSWQAFAERACRGGYLVLLPDLRGHGRSGPSSGWRSFTSSDWTNMPSDIGVLQQALIQHGADSRNLAVGGEGVGASLALLHAGQSADVQAVVMLSPGLDYHGLNLEEALARHKDLPVLLLAAENDAYAASSAYALKASAAGFCELRAYSGAAHGTDLLAASPNAAEQIIQWLDAILK